MSHIHRCGVLKASAEQQQQWIDETMQYMSERYTGLSKEDLGQLEDMGKRFCSPVIAHGAGNTAMDPGVAEPMVEKEATEEVTEATSEAADATEETEEKEMAGAV